MGGATSCLPLLEGSSFRLLAAATLIDGVICSGPVLIIELRWLEPSVHFSFEWNGNLLLRPLLFDVISLFFIFHL